MFCETRELKSVSWLSTCGLLKEQGVPLTYHTKSKVLILTNDFQTLSKKLGALQDRGWHLVFKPSDAEILNKMKQIKGYCNLNLSKEEIDEVYNLIESYSAFCNFSLRTFVKGLSLFIQCKEENIDWKEILLREMGVNSKFILINKCLNHSKNEGERISFWESQGFSRRSYYDYKAKFRQKCKGYLKIPCRIAQTHQNN